MMDQLMNIFGVVKDGLVEMESVFVDIRVIRSNLLDFQVFGYVIFFVLESYIIVCDVVDVDNRNIVGGFIEMEVECVVIGKCK